MTDKVFRILVLLIIIITVSAVILVSYNLANPTVLSSASNITVAGTTLLLALVTYKTVIESRAQAAKAQRAMVRPVLTPQSRLNIEDLANVRDIQVDILNSGSGPAFNIDGVIAPFTENIAGLPKQLSMHHPFPLAGEELVQTQYSEGGTMFKEGDQVAGHSLFIPPHLQPDEGFPDVHDRQYRAAARLTLTYKDVFAFAHASIFDFTQQHKWVLVSIEREIESGIEELDQEKN